MVEIMCRVNPEYQKHVVFKGGKKILYVKVIRSIYGCIEAALLWYQLYKETLEKEGFILNPYEMCIANKVIDGKQCTVAWYVDDSKISHKDERVIDEVIKGLESRFWKMTVKRGKDHTFVGMDITYNDDKTVSISMNDYITECIESFGKKALMEEQTAQRNETYLR